MDHHSHRRRLIDKALGHISTEPHLCRFRFDLRNDGGACCVVHSRHSIVATGFERPEIRHGQRDHPIWTCREQAPNGAASHDRRCIA
jgi:hypothetical protein